MVTDKDDSVGVLLGQLIEGQVVGIADSSRGAGKKLAKNQPLSGLCCNGSRQKSGD